MKLTKFDYIQIMFNALLIVASVLNVLYLCGILPQWATFIGLVLAMVGCVATNVLAKGDNNRHRAEVNGIPALATLTYLTGLVWLITYGISLFANIDLG